MIDLRTEALLTVKAAVEWLKARGATIHPGTIYRWMSDGSLDSVTLGGKRYTSMEALQRHALRGQQVQQKQQRKRRCTPQDDSAALEFLRAEGVID
jgi:hypothetical protein